MNFFNKYLLGSKQGMLKKLKKKDKHEIKKISQAKMNVYFIFGLAFIVLLSILSIVASLTHSTQAPIDDSPTSVVEGTDEVDNRLQLFLDGYVSAYFNFDIDGTDQQETLDSYYNFVPETKSQGQKRESTSLVSSRLVQIEKNVAIYKVTYETGSENDTQRITVLFGIPYGGENGQYYVSGLPYFQAVEDLKATDVDSSGNLSLNSIDDVTEEDRERLKSFLELFFQNYTTSQENLDIVSKNIKAINGAVFDTIDFTFFNIKENGDIVAYVQATFEIAGTTHSENFTLYMSQKGDSFFVDKMEHIIPSDYMTVEKRK